MPHGWLDSFDPAPQFTSEHHLLHAFYAFYTSPFQKALVMVVDGCGPKSPTGGCESSVLYTASRRGTVELLANETVLVLFDWEGCLRRVVTECPGNVPPQPPCPPQPWAI